MYGAPVAFIYFIRLGIFEELTLILLYHICRAFIILIPVRNSARLAILAVPQ